MPTKETYSWVVSQNAPDVTYTRSPMESDDPEWEPMKELTFRQKLALEWIIFKAWCRRAFGRA